MPWRLNHQSHDCILRRLFGHRSKKTSKLRVTGLCPGNSPVTGEFPPQMASNTGNVSIWWRHHVFFWYIMALVDYTSALKRRNGFMPNNRQSIIWNDHKRVSRRQMACLGPSELNIFGGARAWHVLSKGCLSRFIWPSWLIGIRWLIPLATFQELLSNLLGVKRSPQF